MRTSVPSTFDNDLLQAVYESRSLVIIGFVLVVALARQLTAMQFELVALALLVAIAPLMLVVVIGLLLQAGRWLRTRL